MPKRNMHSPYAAKIEMHIKEYKKACSRSAAGSAELRRAKILAPALCLRAKSAKKNIASYGKLSEKDARAFLLAEEFLSGGTTVGEEELCTFLEEKGEKFGAVMLSLLPDAIFASIFANISRLFCEGKDEEISRYIFAAEKLRFIDFTRIFLAFSSSVHIFSQEKCGVFAWCDDKTKLKYISALVTLCKKEGRGEEELAKELVAKADANEVHVGELIFEKKPYVGRTYAVCLAFSVILVSAVYFLLCGRGVPALVTLPAAAVSCYGMLKEIFAICFKCAGSDGLMRMSAAKAGEEKAVVAIMSILSGGESDGELFERLENFYLAEENKNRFYAIVCNLPDSKKRKNAADEKIISSALARIEALNAKYGNHFGIFVRERRYSRTEGKYIGWERKRGAVLELCRFMRGEKTSISRYIADKGFLESSKYLITLDADTNLYAGAENELIGTVLHPLNTPVVRNGAVVSGHAIVQPRIVPTLESSAASAFANITSGNGGVDSYAGAAFDIYENVFGGGSFCGKGILNVDVFLSVCGDFFKCERILSHDMLEGNLACAAIASDIILTDSTPKNALAYYVRHHRWLRGDLQTLPYLLPYVTNERGEKIKNPMGTLAKYKIADNIISAIQPYTSLWALFFIAFASAENLLLAAPFLLANLIFPVIRAVIALFLPGGAKKASRRYRAHVMPHLLGGIYYSFYKISALPYEALLFADAAVRTAYRFLISHRNFLNWKTAAAAEKEKAGLGRYISSMWFSFAAGAAAIISGEIFFVTLGFIWLFFPFFAFLISEEWGGKREISPRERENISEYATEMWGFFRDMVGEKTNFLPPDNCAYSPAESTAYRTSPTNIGLYLTSLIGARDLSLITGEELCTAAERTSLTLSRLPRWHGHLYNWYDIKTLEILGEPFVSTVDSGNFAVALCAFCEGLREYAAECPRLLSVMKEYEEMIKSMDFSVLYNKSARLFYIGYDVKREKYSTALYDTFMSESRMASFFAVATGQVPREHFFAASRRLVASGGYVGVASWSGTVFEYFMPSLFLPTIPSSVTAEALDFAYRMQKKNAVKRDFMGKRRKIFGVSESGYWLFDSEMNYQYKAFGVRELALDPEGYSAPVISPYSSFLMLRENTQDVLANLETLEKMGMRGKYGFYEAIDCEKKRVGEGFAVIKSYMAHHVGMSFIASVNMLKDDIFPRRFMRIPKMRAFRELLCEKIDVGGTVTPKKIELDNFNGEEWRAPAASANREKTKYNLLFPDVAMLSNNKLRLIASSSGHISAYSGEIELFASDFERFSHGEGLHFYLCADGAVYPLLPLCARSEGTESTFEFEYNDEKISYISRHTRGEAQISAELILSVCSDREMFFAECRAEGDYKKAHLFVYGTPVLQRSAEFAAHKSFSALFLESEYFTGEEALLFARRKRDGGEEKLYLGVRAFPPVYGGDFDTVKEEALPLAQVESDVARLACGDMHKSVGAMITPMLSMRTYGVHGLCSFAFAVSSSEEELLFLLCEKNTRRKQKFASVCRLQYGASGLSPSDIWLKNMLLRAFRFPSLPPFGAGARPSRDIFWRRGISGENRMVAATFAESAEASLRLIIRIFKYMCICGERFDLIILYDENDAYRGAVREKIERIAEKEGCRAFISRDCGIHPISESELSADEKTAILHLCEVTVNLDSLPTAQNASGFFEISREAQERLKGCAQTRPRWAYQSPKESLACVPCGDFTPQGFRVRKGHGGLPFASVAYGADFGFVATENSLGFSFFENAALGKLTPHTAGGIREDGGERILLRVYVGAKFEDYDLCALASFADFGENGVRYGGKIGESEYAVCVFPDAEKPLKKIEISFSPVAPNGAELLLAVKPCLGERSEKNGRYIYERAENTLFVSTVFENPLTLAVSCTCKADFIADEAEFISGGSICGGEKIAALKTAAENNVSFYLAAITPMFSRTDFIGFVNRNDFRKSEPAPIFESANIRTGNVLFDISVNRLFPYQTYYSRFRGRTGFYQVGGAYGFRDQLQDSLSFLENAPELCRRQIILAAAHQYREGDAAHWWHTYAGKETCLRSRYADDLLWLPFALCEYIEKTGDESLLSVSAPYLSSSPLDLREHERYEELETEGEGTVLEHALLAAHTVWSRGFGAHGLLLFGGGDWNDGMNLVGARGKGESVWLTEFAAVVYIRLARLLERKGICDEAEFFRNGAAELYKGFSCAYDGNRFLRGYYDNGLPLGKKGNPECEIDALSQSFAVFAEHELFGKVGERAHTAILTAYEQLFDSRNGIMKLLSPPFDKGKERPGYIKGYLPGIRENGGQYTHAAVWAAMALMLAGEKEKGFSVLKAINPAVRSTESDFCRRYKIEPYALAGDVYSHPDCIGRGGWSHYTGAAAWYRKAVLETVFGLKLCGDCFTLSPNMTEELDRAELSLDIRSTRYKIRYFFGEESGIVLDGKIIETNGEKMRTHALFFDGGEHTVDFCMSEY